MAGAGDVAMEWHRWQASGHESGGPLVHAVVMPARPDRVHIALAVLMVLGAGFRLLRPDAGAGPAAAGPVGRRSDPRPTKAQRKAAPTRPARARPDSARVSEAAPRIESTPAGSRPVENVVAPNAVTGHVARTRVDPSQASVDELATLPGIGPALARRIVEEREAHGKYASMDDLRRVKGIGAALSERIAPYVTFGPNGRPNRVTSGANEPVRNGARTSRRVRRRSSPG